MKLFTDHEKEVITDIVGGHGWVSPLVTNRSYAERYYKPFEIECFQGTFGIIEPYIYDELTQCDLKLLMDTLERFIRDSSEHHIHWAEHHGYDNILQKEILPKICKALTGNMTREDGPESI
ncbi:MULTISPECIES: hypothetical protein [unclassified Psychrobacter]|uniref:hypothetical protein n=1 Tax=unclassified Psychrobacter TaxID=196806 RepID=UPI00402B7A8D